MIRQTAKLKPPPNVPRIQYTYMHSRARARTHTHTPILYIHTHADTRTDRQTDTPQEDNVL